MYVRTTALSPSAMLTAVINLACLPAASDVTYEQRCLPALAALLRRLVVANPGAETLLAHRHRSAELDACMMRTFQGGWSMLVVAFMFVLLDIPD